MLKSMTFADFLLAATSAVLADDTAALRQNPASALADTEVADVEVLFLLGAAWGLAISNALDQPSLIADLPAVRALFARALELDEDYERGALHSALITLEALPAQLGGSPERARAHFERAVELSAGLDASRNHVDSITPARPA